MNFEFIKNLQGLNKAFDCFVNAEDLAISKPDLSVVASRKGAEALAKYIYLYAHSQEAEYLTFSDILCDPVVKKYLNNVAIMDAFHYIRKKGNVAVHTLNKETSENAISVLKKLHFAVGEAAKRMGMIKKYPDFDSNLNVNYSVHLKEFDSNALAQEMYDDYIVSKHKVNKLLLDFENISNKFKIIPGYVDLGETIEFKSKPIFQSTITKIQEHFGFVIMQALKSIYGDSVDDEMFCSATLTIYGAKGYTTSDLFEVVKGIFYDLPKAEGFKISNVYSGPSIASTFNNEVCEEFHNIVEKFDVREKFTYTIIEFLYNHGSCFCGKFENHSWIDLEKDFSSEILDKNYNCDWWSWNVDLYVDFDFENHSEILSALHEVVRKYIPEDQLEQCEQEWENGEPGYLVSSIGWYPKKMRFIQDFLDEINEILEPIKSECNCGCVGSWYITEAPFSIATWSWTDDGFKILGVSY